MQRLTVLVLAAFLLAACSDDSRLSESRTQLPTLDEPCSLLSRVEVARATGSQVRKVERGTSMTTLEKSGCLYRTDGPYGAILVDLDRSGEQEFRDFVDEASRGEHGSAEVVSHLGDEAYLFGRASLSVLSGEAVVHVGTQNYRLDGPAVLRSLAELALKRL